MIHEPTASPFRSVLTEEITSYLPGEEEAGDDPYTEAKAVNIERMRANLESGCEAISGRPLEGEALLKEQQLNRQAQLLARKAAEKRFRR